MIENMMLSMLSWIAIPPWLIMSQLVIMSIPISLTGDRFSWERVQGCSADQTMMIMHSVRQRNQENWRYGIWHMAYGGIECKTDERGIMQLEFLCHDIHSVRVAVQPCVCHTDEVVLR